jgi:hypothetical protein
MVLRAPADQVSAALINPLVPARRHLAADHRDRPHDGR